MISTILVATDGSEAAAAAERFGASLCARLKVRLQGLSVVEDRFARGFQEDGLGVTPPPPDAVAAYLKARADASCRRLSEAASGSGVERSCDVAQGIADEGNIESSKDLSPHGPDEKVKDPLPASEHGQEV